MASKPNKTQASARSVPDFLAAVAPDGRREDAVRLCEIMQDVSGEPAMMWEPGMIGFGVRHYKYESGREGDIFRIGFAPRKTALVLYGLASAGADRLASLGKGASGGKGDTKVSCTYIKRLDDVDLGALTAIIADVWAK